MISYEIMKNVSWISVQLFNKSLKMHCHIYDSFA